MCLSTVQQREGSRVTAAYKSQREQARRDSVVRIARQSKELDDYGKFIAPEE
jgi:hypothetical protein